MAQLASSWDQGLEKMVPSTGVRALKSSLAYSCSELTFVVSFLVSSDCSVMIVILSHWKHSGKGFPPPQAWYHQESGLVVHLASSTSELMPLTLCYFETHFFSFLEHGYDMSAG